MRNSTFALFFAFCICLAPIGRSSAAELAPALHLLPRPASVNVISRCSGYHLHRGLRFASDVDPSARELLDERWRGLGIPASVPISNRTGQEPDLTLTLAAAAPQSYHLSVREDGISILAGDADGAFYAFATLAQLAYKTGGGYALPCVDIDDAPALRLRVLSDDVSRGPLPTMRYFEERIRTIAAFKMNGYSPYMEHVFADPRHPLPAPLDGITPKELAHLDAYARRFHVTFIPEQQTFAHMHNTLRWERYAPLAETPHGYLLTPAEPKSEQYVRDVIADELAAVPHPRFFHIGSDEPFDLGRGRSKALTQHEGRDAVYARHVTETAKFVFEKSGARPMVWSDAFEQHPEMFAGVAHSVVFVNWHYDAEKSFAPYIERIAKAGFDQTVAPGTGNWNEIYPDCDTALENIDRFVTQGKAAHVLGLFQTVWHDDGETLFEATWYPVLYAASSAWERGAVDKTRFAADFPAAFFGVDDPRYADDIAALARARTLLHTAGDPVFWADPFDPPMLARLSNQTDLSGMRLAAERVIEHMRTTAPPPLHPNAAAVMHLAARRYDLLARNAQIAKEARDRYAEASSHLHQDDNLIYADLFAAKYLLWEQRDAFLELEPLVRAAWEYEDRAGHELSVLERYHLAAQRAIVRADAIRRATYEGYKLTGALPGFDAIMGIAGVP